MKHTATRTATSAEATLFAPQTTTITRESETLYGWGERKKVTKSQAAEEILRPFFDDIEGQESFHVLVMSRENTVMGHKVVSFGGVAGCIADPKIIFRYALQIAGAAGIIVSHNHPSGNLTPSQADHQITKKLKQAGAFLDMPVLDHLILSPDNRYYSFADEGEL